MLGVKNLLAKILDQQSWNNIVKKFWLKMKLSELKERVASLLCNGLEKFLSLSWGIGG